jgi:hypothetical protein
VIPTVNIVPLRLDDKHSDSNDTLLDAARRIQTEINEISRPEYSGVSLLEIAEWTGVRIDTCVNFLRLPEQELKAPSNGDQVKFALTAIQREEFEDLSGAAPVSEKDSIPINGNGVAPPGAAETSPGLEHPSASMATQNIFLVSGQMHITSACQPGDRALCNCLHFNSLRSTWKPPSVMIG